MVGAHGPRVLVLVGVAFPGEVENATIQRESLVVEVCE